MKKSLKVFTIVVILVAVFTTGALANNWLSFTGTNQAESTEDNISEILDILDQVSRGSGDAEEALRNLREQIAQKDDQIQELVKENTDLKQKIWEKDIELVKKDEMILEKIIEIQKKDERIAELESLLENSGNDDEYTKHLEEELKKANETVVRVEGASSEALEEAKKYLNK